MEAINEALAKLTKGKNIFTQPGYLSMLAAVQNPTTNPLSAHSEFLHQQFMAVLTQRNASLQPVTRSLSPMDQSTVNTFLASQDFSPPLRRTLTPEKKNKTSPFTIDNILENDNESIDTASTSHVSVQEGDILPVASPAPSAVVSEDQKEITASQELKNVGPGTPDVINNNNAVDKDPIPLLDDPVDSAPLPLVDEKTESKEEPMTLEEPSVVVPAAVVDPVPISETPKRAAVPRERKPRVYKPRSTRKYPTKITTPQNVILEKTKTEPEFKIPTPPDRARIHQIQQSRRRHAKKEAEEAKQAEQAKRQAEQERGEEPEKKLEEQRAQEEEEAKLFKEAQQAAEAELAVKHVEQVDEQISKKDNKVNENISASANKTASEDASEIINENARENIIETAKKTASEDASGTINDKVAEDVCENSSEVTSEEINKNASQNIIETANKTTGEDASGIINDKVTEDVCESSSKGTSEEINENASENTIETVNKTVSEDTSKKINQKITEDVCENSSKVTSKDDNKKTSEETSQPPKLPKIYELVDLTIEDDDEDFKKDMPKTTADFDVDLLAETLISSPFPRKCPNNPSKDLSFYELAQETWIRKKEEERRRKQEEFAKANPILHRPMTIKMEPEDYEEMPEVRFEDIPGPSYSPPSPENIPEPEKPKVNSATEQPAASTHETSADQESDEEFDIDKEIQKIYAANKAAEEAARAAEAAKAAEAQPPVVDLHDNPCELQAEDTASSAGTPSISPPRTRKRRSTAKPATEMTPKRRSTRIKDSQATLKEHSSFFDELEVLEEASPEKQIKTPRVRAPNPDASPRKRVRRTSGVTKRSVKRSNPDKNKDEVPRKRKLISRTESNRQYFTALSTRLLDAVMFPSAEGECQILDHFQYPVIRRAIVNKNTLCYSISMMQVMLRVPQIYSIVRSHNHENGLRLEKCFLCMLTKAITTKPSYSDYGMFINLLKETWPSVAVNDMHCCMEAMQHFFDRFDVDFQKFHSKYITNAEIGHSPSRSFFEIEMSTKYTCVVCKNGYQVKDKAIYLSVTPVKNTRSTMQELVDNFSEPTTTTGMHCSFCKSEGDSFTCVTKFEKLPEVLLYFVPRVVSKKSEKDMTVVEIQKKIQVQSNGVDHEYSLCSFVIHHGDNGKKGHYKSFEVNHHEEHQPYNLYDDSKVEIDSLLNWEMTLVLAMFRKVDAVQKDHPTDIIYDGRGNISYAAPQYEEESQLFYEEH